MPSHVQSAYIQNGMKLFSRIVLMYLNEQDHQKIIELAAVIEEAIEGLICSSDLEVQERASVMQQFLKYIMKHVQKGEFFKFLPTGTLPETIKLTAPIPKSCQIRPLIEARIYNLHFLFRRRRIADPGFSSFLLWRPEPGCF